MSAPAPAPAQAAAAPTAANTRVTPMGAGAANALAADDMDTYDVTRDCQYRSHCRSPSGLGPMSVQCACRVCSSRLRKELLCHKWQHAHTNLHPLMITFSRSRWKAAKIKELQVGYSACPPAQSGDWAASAGSIRWRPSLPCLMRLSWRLTPPHGRPRSW